MKLQSTTITGLLMLLVLACGHQQKQSTNNDAAANFFNNYIDTTVRPQDDFFKYAMGKWIKANPIPASERSWGIWSLVDSINYNRLRKINEEAMNSNAAKGSNEQKIGDFWAAGMDSNAVDAQGLKPLQPEFDKINAVKDKQSLVDELAHLQVIGVGAGFSGFVSQDETNSSVYSLHFYQGGIGLPERDYYFNTDARTKNIRDEYVKHVAKMFVLMGDDSGKAKTEAATVMRMETALAKASRKLEDLQDPYANYHKMSIAAFDKVTPAIQWQPFLQECGMTKVDTVIVGQPEFFKQLQQSLTSESIDNWKTYMRWGLINTFASNLSHNFDQENFHFYGTIMSGVEQQRPRWKRVLQQEENYLGDAMGQLYVQKYFTAHEKARYDTLVQNIVDAYHDEIQNLDWMSDSTKKKALEKLSVVMRKVGYPTKWKDYSSYDVTRDSYVMNALNGNIWLFNYYANKLGKPVDRTEWGMTPQTYNAYYNPSNNEIVLPAAAFILPGLPDSLADDAIVYGYAAASTIGHEITHGFDDQGRRFDDKGNLKNWWTLQDSAEFDQRVQRIINQFNHYVVLDSMHVNGKASQGENIADLGGVVLGLKAFEKTDEYKSGKKIGGYTPTQRFFLGYALSWLGSFRNASIAQQVMTDVHSPNFLRVNGPVSNVPEFYTAFNVKPGDSMYRSDSVRVKIW